MILVAKTNVMITLSIDIIIFFLIMKQYVFYVYFFICNISACEMWNQ